MKCRFLFLIGLAVSIGANCQTIKPGQTWNDTSGSAINAHGGCVQYYDGTYYWFGETRSGSTCNGVSCYSSTDLINWKKLSNAMTPTGTKTDANVDVAQGRTIERPKVIYNEKTGKWVMWFHWENGSDYGQAKVAVLTSDKITGPYTLTQNGVFRPNDKDSRDQTLFLDTDGRAYHVSSTETNYRTHFIRLSDDFTRPTEEESLQVLGARYEAASMFKYGDSYWCLFSGCDGWNANRGRYIWYVGDDPLDNWSYGMDFYANNSYGVDFCVDNGNSNCYQSQPAYVFPVQGRDKCFIYMGDRWTSSNVGGSKYVWCPLSIRSGYPAVRWYDSWNLSVFDNMYQRKRLATLEEGKEIYLLEKHSDRIMSRPSTGWTLDDDNDKNVCFILHETDEPYTWMLEQKSSGKFFACTALGTMKLVDGDDADVQQKWTFVLQEDGYYYIKSNASGKVLSVSGNSTQAGTSLYMTERDYAEKYAIHQSFAVYYDSKDHPEYEEADMYSKEYRDANIAAMEVQQKYFDEQEEALKIGSVDIDSDKEAVIYTLQGVRVNTITKPGFYIVDGEKVYIR